MKSRCHGNWYRMEWGLSPTRRPALVAGLLLLLVAGGGAMRLLDYVVKEHGDDFWVGTFTEVAQYAQERDTAKVECRADSGGLRLTLTDRMDDHLFDVPLTVKVRIDPAWQRVAARQNQKELAVTVIDHAGGCYALVEAVPDRGAVFLMAN